MAATLRVLLAVCLTVFLGLSVLPQTRAQTPAAPVSSIDAALSEDIVIGSRILAESAWSTALVTSARGIQPTPIIF